MKKIIVITLLLFVFACFFPSVVSADMLPDGAHPFSRAAKFVNLDEFPDIILVGHYATSNRLVSIDQVYRIDNNVRLYSGGYNLSIYWNTRDKIDSFTQLNSNNFVATIQPEATWTTSSHLIKDEIQYSIAGFSDGKLIIYISKRISEYDNGNPVKVENFNSPLGNIEPVRIPPFEKPKTGPLPTPLLEPVKTGVESAPSSEPQIGFWQSLQYEQKFIFALLLTWIIEISVAAILIKSLFKHREIKFYNIIFAGLIASALTLPYLWFILPIYISNNVLYVLLGELLVILVETIIYYQFLKLKLPQSFLVSLIANIASVFIGISLI